MTAPKKIPITHFAPAERVPIEIVHRQVASFSATPFASELLTCVLDCVLVLNAQRQIVFASRNALRLMPSKTAEGIHGLRPGEALECIHANDCESGCGTGEFCSQCGAAWAILNSLAGQPDLRECHLTRVVKSQEESLDLLVLATPFIHNKEMFSVVSIADISHGKRRRAVEQLFSHEVIDLAAGAGGRLTRLTARAPADIQSDTQLSHAAVHQLLEELQARRDLAAAERGDLAVSPATVNSGEVLREVVSVCQEYPAAKGRHLRIASGSAEKEFTTDPRLLKRVLNHLIKNALEASSPCQAILMSCEMSGSQLRFNVHNPSFMRREIQLQIFKRSFTTKGPGRGLGTYSVKLLTENYLKGNVGFTTSFEGGTLFQVTLPVVPG